MPGAAPGPLRGGHRAALTGLGPGPDGGWAPKAGAHEPPKSSVEPEAGRVPVPRSALL